MTQLICRSEKRREEVRQKPRYFGLDDLQVGDDQRTLTVHFLGKAPQGIGKDNVLIEGGRRIRNIRVLSAETESSDKPELDDTLEVVVDRPGDFSTYTLRIVARDTQGHPQRHPAFDPRYESIEFSFKVDCPSDLDCKIESQCPPVERTEPDINYLAKDYASFRQLILDRMALVMPDWRERHVPDLGVALIEVLAYVGDYLSYYQDAVATEAYLGTARQRISVQRHARLVDYRMHEGCNARTWVTIETESDLLLDPDDTFFVTCLDDVMQAAGVALKKDELDHVASGSYETFEPLTRETIRLYKTHNPLRFYTWGDDECCLERGATTATLIGELVKEKSEPPPPACDPSPQGYAAQDQDKAPMQTEPRPTPKLYLRVGDVLIFEEVIGPKTGAESDADPAHRHAVRLTDVKADVDPLNDQPIVEIVWAAADSLPFTLCLSTLGPPPQCEIIYDISVARGNVLLVDHGQKLDEEELEAVPQKEIIESCECAGKLADRAIISARFNPHLQKAPLVFREILASGLPAARALQQDPRKALPQIRLTSDPTIAGKAKWRAQGDLFSSLTTDQHFVAEIDNEGRAHLRFGDGELGRLPEAGMKFKAQYRIGQATAGNVGAETIRHLVGRTTKISGGVTNVRNPFPAHGGIAPESIIEAKLFAPYALRKDLERAVTAADYATIVEREFKDKVQRAVAQLRWMGSSYEVVVAIDPFEREEADSALRAEIALVLNRYRRIGHDVKVLAAARVPLAIEMTVCAKPHYLQGYIKAALLNLFSPGLLPDGRKGFFHPDNLTFGEGIFLSKLIAAAFAVEGVENVQVTKLQRRNEAANQELETGFLQLGAFEIAQCDSDPSFPEHGQLMLKMGGGR